MLSETREPERRGGREGDAPYWCSKRQCGSARATIEETSAASAISSRDWPEFQLSAEIAKPPGVAGAGRIAKAVVDPHGLAHGFEDTSPQYPRR